ncbi:MAG: TadE/TadG family type IV pilus assembly protein [Eubacteriales bacterium]|nr:TadE/TadG family type IV pilus assembly protein [Eubacteriales bacterium]
MKRIRQKKGSLTIEASIVYPIFMMIIVTMLYIMRIVYAYGLVQHAVAQTARELSMYTYIYQVTGANDIYQSAQSAASDRTTQFNQDADHVVKLYQSLMNDGYTGQTYEGTTDPVEILKNVGGALVGEASSELNNRLFELVAKPMVAGYIGADSMGNSADSRLKALRVIGGLDGIDFSSSSFFEDGTSIDLVACYTIDPLMPIDIMPKLNLMNRASVRGMSGKTIFSRKADDGQAQEKSVWDMESDVKRGKAIQEQEGVRNLPDNFKTFSAFDAGSGKATAEKSIDLRSASYQDVSKIRNAIRSKCSDMENYTKTTYAGVTLDPSEIRSKELILYIPSSTGDRKIDRSKYDQAVAEAQKDYPDIRIVTKEID